jgi:hypothetical protein
MADEGPVRHRELAHPPVEEVCNNHAGAVCCEPQPLWVAQLAPAHGPQRDPRRSRAAEKLHGGPGPIVRRYAGHSHKAACRRHPHGPRDRPDPRPDVPDVGPARDVDNVHRPMATVRYKQQGGLRRVRVCIIQEGHETRGVPVLPVRVSAGEELERQRGHGVGTAKRPPETVADAAAAQHPWVAPGVVREIIYPHGAGVQVGQRNDAQPGADRDCDGRQDVLHHLHRRQSWHPF